jgi:phospholipid-binding lipoprotein MlaA
MRKILISLSALLSISGCAPINTGNDKDIDPYKTTNEEIFKLNHSLDKHIIKPIAQIYDYLIPDTIETRISMFFSNLGEVSVISNDILQSKFYTAANDTARLLINSSFGMFGLFDMATDNGFPKHKQNFALTLNSWGFKDSPYIVMPIFGASTVFDSFSLPIDNFALSPIAYIKPYSLAMSLYVTDKINIRANIMPYDKIILDAFDPYLMLRNAYLQKRQQEITENEKLN